MCPSTLVRLLEQILAERKIKLANRRLFFAFPCLFAYLFIYSFFCCHQLCYHAHTSGTSGCEEGKLAKNTHLGQSIHYLNSSLEALFLVNYEQACKQHRF